MHYAKRLVFLVVSFTLLALTGCGGGSGSSSSNPFANDTSTSGSGNGNTTTPSTGIVSGLTLTTDVKTIDVNNGQVLVTATFTTPNQALTGVTGLSGVPVTFSIVAPTNGPATIEAGLVTVKTDASGNAFTRITTGNTPVTTNVIVMATVGTGTQAISATTTFQIVRGNGVIMFTDAAGASAGSQSNMLPLASKTVDPPTSGWTFFQLLPFKVTDSNGNPRVGVPVTLSVYSIAPSKNPTDVTIDFLVPTTIPEQATVTTDSAGMGIFNVAVTLLAPPPGLTNTDSIVFKAVTNDAIPVTAYVGGQYSLTTTIPKLVISPSTALFGTATDINFIISGGTAPYVVTSSNPNLVSVSVTGSIVTAHLVNNTPWTETVTITVTDSSGQVQSSSITR